MRHSALLHIPFKPNPIHIEEPGDYRNWLCGTHHAVRHIPYESRAKPWTDVENEFCPECQAEYDKRQANGRNLTDSAYFDLHGELPSTPQPE